MKNFLAVVGLLIAPSLSTAQSAQEMMTPDQIEASRTLAESASRCRPGSAAAADIVVDPRAVDLRGSCPSDMSALTLYYFDDAGARREVPLCDLLQGKTRDEVTPLLVASARRIDDANSDTRPLSPVNRYVAHNAGLIYQLAAKLNPAHSPDARHELEIRSTETGLDLSADAVVKIGGDYCDIFPAAFKCNRY